MGTPIPAALAVVTLLASTLALAGCSFLEPTRDTDGRVVKAIQLASPDLRIGDCFSFVDGTDHAQSLVTPCADPHAYIVIGQGTLSSAAIDRLGGLQNAVSVSCADVFAAFVAAATDGVTPKPEFVVTNEDTLNGPVTSYSCLATDGTVVAAG